MKIGFIGAGRMATALARGCAAAGLIEDGGLLASDPSDVSKTHFRAAAPGAIILDTNADVLAETDTVVLAVKPQVMPAVLADIRTRFEPRHLVISIAAGITLRRLADELPPHTRLVRVMPNTPCLIGQGVSCYSRGNTATMEDGKVVEKLLQSVGSAFEVPETQLDAVTGLSGSGPAFVYTAIEAMALGGVAAGLPPQLALTLAASTTRGAAAMVLETGLNPVELRDQVTSPGGTTLAGLDALRAHKGDVAFTAAVQAATKRSIELGRS